MTRTINKAGLGTMLLQFVVMGKQSSVTYCEWCGKRLQDCQHSLHYCQHCHGMGMLNDSSCDCCKGTGLVCTVHKIAWD